MEAEIWGDCFQPVGWVLQEECVPFSSITLLPSVENPFSGEKAMFPSL
jgi:hypothetical protein